ncbi:MAG: hypothetical protein R6X22_11290 [Gemmatimonadota bacterium]
MREGAERPLTRRHFLGLSAGIAVAGLVPLTGCGAAPDGDETLGRPETLSRLADDATLRSIGRSYRTETPTESDAESLRALLLDGSPESADWSGLERRLRERIRADFDSDRTVLVDGWLLSVTEARQAAFFSLRP